MRDSHVADSSGPSADDPPSHAQTGGPDDPSISAQLVDARHRLGIGAAFLRSLAEGFREWRMPSRATACEHMAYILEDE